MVSSGGGQLPWPGLNREAKYRGRGCCAALNRGLCPWHGVGGQEESCQWGPGGWYPHPAASRPRGHGDTDSTCRTGGVTQRHTRAHAGTPEWGVSTRALCPRSPQPLIVGTSRCGCWHVWGHAWRDGPGWMLGSAARIWGSHSGEGISQARTVHTRCTHVFTCTHQLRCAHKHTLTRTSHTVPLACPLPRQDVPRWK